MYTVFKDKENDINASYNGVFELMLILRCCNLLLRLRYCSERWVIGYLENQFNETWRIVAPKFNWSNAHHAFLTERFTINIYFSTNELFRWNKTSGDGTQNKN